MIKAIALLSGGLDSTLAIKVLLEQGIEVEALNFITLFCRCTAKGSTCLASQKAAQKLGIDLRVINISEEFLSVVKHPKYGYGKNVNPCLDCRILMFNKGREYMNQNGASFIVTGEVLGERPMSQRRVAMQIIERESGLQGLILRPLSAKLLSLTVPEKTGWVNRESLLAIAGRSRKPQIKLASDYGINDYPCPAGGCLLTDPGFALRMMDLMGNKPDFLLNDVHLLKLGRHFRITPLAKVVVGRNERENVEILSLAKEGDTVLRVKNFPGPLALARGEVSHQEILRSAVITAKYSKAKFLPEVEVEYQLIPRPSKEILISPSMVEDELKLLRIN
ncbi:MAG: tRNA 4-thiouridine(8) synthase ThiI [Syntrophobacterales bacterium]|nr:MAG: tRNA 4-thiouridine(8) synthase ThiI [Syntrophobacterales bacterium]